jgi:hypothetical protein
MIRQTSRLRWRLAVCAVDPAKVEMRDEQGNRAFFRSFLAFPQPKSLFEITVDIRGALS